MSLPLLPLLLACAAGGEAPPDDTDDGLDCGNPQTFYPDLDGDGYGDTSAALEECRAPDGYTRTPGDCDDSDPAVSPAGDEVCNGIDDDCDGVVDPETAEGALTCFDDADGDGFGDPDTAEVVCDCGPDQVQDATDCDDDDVSIHPGAEDPIYDGIDQACDGDAGEYDRDGDGYNAVGTGAEPEGDCDDADPEIHPGMLDRCDDDIDQDCDGLLDECGLASTTRPEHAWWTVSRDLSVEGDSAVFGWEAQYAGDSDSDGRPELLVKETSQYNEVESFCRFHLVEVPAGTSGGDALLDDVVTATWSFPVTNDCATRVRAPSSLADVDLDHDGYPDFVLVPSVSNSVGHPATAVLSYGPVAGEQDLASLSSVPGTDALFAYGPARLLEDGTSSGDWVLAQSVWPEDDTIEGDYHPGIVFLTPEAFSGGASLDEAPAIYTDGHGREVRDNMIVEDIDADGVRDIVAASRPARADGPAGRVWFLHGPFDAAVTHLDDADVIIDRGPDAAISFGISIDLLDDGDRDGHRTVAVGDPAWRDDQHHMLHLIEPSALSAGIHIGVDDAFARIEASAEEGVDAPIEPALYPSQLVSDIDGNGLDELAVPTVQDTGGEKYRVHIMDIPAAGVETLDDPHFVLTTDEDLDELTGFGARIIGDRDFDGDGWTDLLIGEPYWNADKEDLYRPYGRFMIYRGDGDW